MVRTWIADQELPGALQPLTVNPPDGEEAAPH
jgi:hypothetical protein